MRRLGVFAHYDAQEEVKDYVLHHLAALRPLCQRLVFVSTAPLDARGRARAGRHCDELLLQQNAGFDFGMWKSVLLNTRLDAFDALLLANSSVFGPITPLGPIVHRMEEDDSDFWSMTESTDYTWHLQSYFLGFKARALHSSVFHRFWESVLPWKDKMQAIRSGEVALTVFMREAGFVGRAAFPTASLARRSSLVGLPSRPGNPTARYPAALLDAGMPFVKVNVLRENPFRARLGPVRRRMRQRGYDENLIEFDRPPDPQFTGGRRWLRNPLLMPARAWLAPFLPNGWRRSR